MIPSARDLLVLGVFCAAAGAGAPAGATAAVCTRPAAGAPIAAPGELDAVMGLLAMRRDGRVEFVEQQFLAVLDHPIESSGELRYDAPDRLEKRTLLPRPETLLLAGGELTVVRGAQRHVLDLHRYPQIQPFVESIRATPPANSHAMRPTHQADFPASSRAENL